ncbi:hypothetical protein [Hymenobacter tenuis]
MSIDLLKQYITNPLNQVLSSKLSDYFYHDVCDVEYLTTNKQGVDIIAHQLELVFDNKQTIFISWNTVKGWEQYALSIAKKSFTTSSEKFRASNDFWQHYIGSELSRYEIWGYYINTTTSRDTNYNIINIETYYNEPHLALLYFETIVVGVANFYLNKDFIPTIPIGDDIWILFDPMHIQLCIKKLGLEKLEA